MCAVPVLNFKTQTLEVHPVLGFKVLIFYIILICVSLFIYNVSLNFWNCRFYHILKSAAFQNLSKQIQVHYHTYYITSNTTYSDFLNCPQNRLLLETRIWFAAQLVLAQKISPFYLRGQCTVINCPSVQSSVHLVFWDSSKPCSVFFGFHIQDFINYCSIC